MESTRCGINLTVWWEESQMSKQWCFRVNPPVVKIQTLTIYESVIGSIKLSLVVSSCVPQGEFPLLVRLVLLHWNYGFPSCFFSLGKNPVNWDWQTLRLATSLFVFRPCACTSDVLSCPPIPRILHRIAYWPWIICPGSFGVMWCELSWCVENVGGQKLMWVFPNKFGGAQICWWWWRCSKDGLSTGYFLWGSGTPRVQEDRISHDKAPSQSMEKTRNDRSA